MIAVEVSKLCEEEYNSPIVQGIRNNIKQCDSSIDNLLKALESGQEADLLLSRISVKREEKKQLELQLAEETTGKPILTESEIAFFLSDLRDGNINDFKYRQGLINTLVNKIILYKDKVVIFFNSSKDPINLDSDLIKKVTSKPPNNHRTKGCINDTIENSSHMHNDGVPKQDYTNRIYYRGLYVTVI